MYIVSFVNKIHIIGEDHEGLAKQSGLQISEKSDRQKNWSHFVFHACSNVLKESLKSNLL